MQTKQTYLTILLIAYLLISIPVSAQEPTISSIGYINSIELLESVPGKIEATKAIEDLSKKYKEELSRMQNEYNSKYTNFLANQNTLAESIKLRRMQELYELEQNINKFMKVAQEDIQSQEKLLIDPLKEKLKNAIEQIGTEHGFICIYDQANPSIAFITPEAVDANPLVKNKLLKMK